MGRLTQMVEFLNATPEQYQEQKASGLYTHLNIGKKEMECRKSYRKIYIVPN